MTNTSARYKLLLINPKNNYKHGIYHSDEYGVPPINLGIIAALTPGHWEVKIIDENFEGFEYYEADLVGFTALTSQITRAYEIADIYRKNNIPTILGGIHASMIPDEAMNYVDVVVKGEAESVWREVISDFERKSLKPLYIGELLPMVKSPFQRMDLYNESYSLGAIQTTRGCPMQCDFCSVHAINGRKYRHRDVEDVVKEFISIPQQKVYVVDDDFYGYSRASAQRAKDICKGIIASGVQKDWYTFTSMHIASDEEALRLMAQAGCCIILLGIESEVTDQLVSSNKKTNLRIGVDNYSSVYDAMHRQGLAVLGSFIFGLDTDTPESIERRTDYIINSGVDCVQAGILTPLPGTGTYYRLLAEGRITHTNYPKDWEQYTFFNTVIEPKHMTSTELSELMKRSWERMYDVDVLKRKYFKTLKATRSPKAAGWALFTNVNYRNTVFENEKENLSFKKIFKEVSGIDLDSNVEALKQISL
ncbi:MAG: B12-binding domain-containing radical SAM protein [Bacteroidales bacterium]|nr:B12-binding domain-containing radical SAM protein [Bacteroidales bacterium]